MTKRKKNDVNLIDIFVIKVSSYPNSISLCSAGNITVNR